MRTDKAGEALQIHWAGIRESIGFPRRFKIIILFCAGLLVLGAGLTVQGQSTANEPIAYTGHGAMFDQNGREVEPTLAFIRETQAWYRKFLLEKVSREQRAQFDKMENRVTAGFSLDAQMRLLVNAHLLEWLINRADVRDRDRLLGKNNVMKFALAWKLPEKAGGARFPRSLERVSLPPEILQRLRTEPAVQDGPPLALFSTTPAGQAYRNLCIASGVPIPPDWGTSGWVNQGPLSQSDVFISANLLADVYTYQSTSPPGMCIALPRYNTGNTIQLLGVICLAKGGTPSTTANPLTSKACFFDNVINGNTFNPQVGAFVSFDQFGGATEVSDVCSNCHAGENPYVIHPATVLGTLQGLGLPTFGDEWYEPIGAPGWPQNPGPMPSPGACATCHVAGGSARQFPHLSTDFNSSLGGYCKTILNKAILQTMPPGALGTAAQHAAQLQGLCLLGPGGNAATRGDPHLTTVDGVNYDFQSAGEFVALRSTDGMEMQTRQSPVATASTVGPNEHTGLTTCVSLNTAVAARVGTHRVTYQPNLSGVPDPSGLQLRVDGALTTIGARGLDLGSGGRVTKSAVGDGIEIDFPNGVHLTAVPGWWGPPNNKWYLNLDVVNFSARQGIMGNLAPGSWLPALPNGTSLRGRPATSHRRYVDLYQTFANAWRVTSRTTLFDYAPRTSTETFTLRSWPPENGPCTVPQAPVVRPIDPRRAQQACSAIADRNMNANCVFDVTVTGETGFAKTYLLTQQLRAEATSVFVNDDQDSSALGAPVTFNATVLRTVTGKGAPAGTVQFTLDGASIGGPVRLDANGRATWITSDLKAGVHRVAASYTPERGSTFLGATSLDEAHTVRAAATGVTISNLPMQGGDEKTPCPRLGVIFKRSDAVTVPYLRIMLPNLDKQCAARGEGLLAATVTFLKCAPDPRGKSFGPVANADVSCAR